MTYTADKKLTISEWLTENDLDLDKNEVIWLSKEVARKWRDRYPGEELKKVYRPNTRGKYVTAGYGYDDRVLALMEELIEM